MRNHEEEEKSNTVAFKTMERNINKEEGHLARTCKKERRKSNSKEKRCYNCNKTGHFAKDSSKPEGSKERNLYCRICKKNNHIEKDCYFRDRETKQQKNNTEKVSFLTQTPHRTKWIVDSGTTSHMVNSKEYFNNMRRINSKIGVAKTKETMTAERIGSMSFESCSLKEVMYVPDLSVNLLSVNAVNENGGEVTFTKSKVMIKHQNKEILQGQKKENGLYEIVTHLEPKDRSFVTKRSDLSEIWKYKKLHLTFECRRDEETAHHLGRNEHYYGRSEEIDKAM